MNKAFIFFALFLFTASGLAQDAEMSGARRGPTIMGWTVDTSRESLIGLIESNDRRYAERFAAQEKAVGSAMASAEQAVLKAENATAIRFESVNEFRKTLSDQTSTFISRKEAEGLIMPLAQKTTDNASALDKMAGLNTGWVMLGQLISMLASISALVVSFTRRRPLHPES